MRQEKLLQLVVNVLEGSDFIFSRIDSTCSGSFDLVGRRDDKVLVIKVLLSSTYLDRASSMDMRVLCDVLKASPLIIIPPPGDQSHLDGVLYLRYGIPLMTIGTFYDHLIEGVPPMIFRGPGGHFVSIDPGILRIGREDRGMSLGALAEKVGVSRKAIQMYETGMGADIEVAMKLEKVLGVPLIRPLDPFEHSRKLQEIRDRMSGLEGLKKDIFNRLGDLGMEIIPTTSCPFDALARERESLFMTSVENRIEDVKTTADTLSRISRVTGKGSLMIVPRSMRKKNIGGTPVLNVSEVESTKNLEELMEMIRGREK